MNDVAPQSRTLKSRFRDFCKPQSNGLPNWRVVLYPLLALAVVLVALVSLGITGSSTGYLNQFVSSSPDPDLIAGHPEPVRSDEWYVQTSWTISQVEQGLPIENKSFPGGMNTTVQHDLPNTDWSMAFRPHVLGFLVLPLDNAMALKWWLPGFALMAAVYLFVITLLPRRPITAVLLSIGFFFAPFFQWWYLSITFWPAAWALALMAGVVWILRSDRRTPQIVFPLLIGYAAVTVGMGIYVPFIIAATIVALAFSVGFTLTRSASPIVGVWARLVRLKWLFAGGVGAGIILGVWLLTRLSTIESFTGTVYPGERLQKVGDAGRSGLTSLMAGPFSYGLGPVGGVPLGSNASEASTFLLPGVFLVIPLLWLLVRRIRLRVEIDWLSIALLVLGLVLVAYYFVPGWDTIAHLLLLDRSTIGRMRMAVGLLSLVLMVVLTMRLDEPPLGKLRRIPVWIIVVTVGVATLVNATVAVVLYRHGSPLVLTYLAWIPIVLLFAAAVWFFAIKRPGLGAAAFAIMSIVCGATVNPIYLGVYDLNKTALVKEMKSVTADDPGRWVGVGDSALPTVTLVQSGLQSYNGFQSSPSKTMWHQIDPKGKLKNIWNRLANVTWGAGTGSPDPTNPYPDQIRMTFDSCDRFAQSNVEHVLSEKKLSGCVKLVKKVREGPSTFWIYDVTTR